MTGHTSWLLLVAATALAACPVAAMGVHDAGVQAAAAAVGDSGVPAGATGSGSDATPHVLRMGTVVVADTGNDRVRVYHPGGVHAFDLGSRGTGSGEFISPEGVAISGDGIIAVADTGNHRIQVF